MSTTVYVEVEDVDARIDSGYTTINLEYSSSPAGSYSSVDTATLVSGTFSYPFTHAAGTLSTWYRYRFTGTGDPSDYSNPFQVTGLDRKKLRQYTMKKYRAGMVFTTDSNGDSDTISTSDPKVKQSQVGANRGKGTWLMPTTGADAGVMARVKSSIPGSGTFDVEIAFSGEVDTQEVEWYWLSDPETWNACINRALIRYYRPEVIPITGVAMANSYSLSHLPWLRTPKQFLGLWYYPDATTDDPTAGIYTPWKGSGRWWGWREDAGALTIMINPSIAAGSYIYLEALRPGEEVYTDSSIIHPALDRDLLASLVYDEVLTALAQPNFGSGEDKRVWAMARDRHRRSDLKAQIQRNTKKVRLSMPESKVPQRGVSPYRAR